MLLSVNGICVAYDKISALTDVSIECDQGEIVSIIGANGAGKSTLMKSIMGRVKPSHGTIFFHGEAITGLPGHKIVEKGIVCVPEGREIFNGLSVQDNLEVGAISRSFSPKEMKAHFEMVYDMFPILAEKRGQIAGALSGGQQQMLALGRGLMSDPTLMMLDEPSLGLAPIVVDEVFDFIKKINNENGISVILVEQNAYMALEISRRGYVLENGSISREGASNALINDPTIKSAYLGK